jgi:hypothetical protein
VAALSDQAAHGWDVYLYMQSLLQIYVLNAVNVVIKTGWDDFIFIDFAEDWGKSFSYYMKNGRGKEKAYLFIAQAGRYIYTLWGYEWCFLCPCWNMYITCTLYSQLYVPYDLYDWRPFLLHFSRIV